SRRPRVVQVARRGAVNRLAWHASGPVAIARNLFLKMRSSDRLAADLDWLYGWHAAPGR
ncbi:MAG: salicylate hydroxylase, partial [Mesorhizobium sp.]